MMAFFPHSGDKGVFHFHQHVPPTYDLEDNLGKGKYGLVKNAVHKKTGTKVAVKIVKKKEL